MPSNSEHDDSFTLYDLRVEVVCPQGKRIMCGAKAGDYFTLEGEMLYLPPGQGMSIYSLGMYDWMPKVNTSAHPSNSFCAPTARRQATQDIRERLDEHRRAGGMPGPQLSVSTENNQVRCEDVLSF
jgi:uncharacterized repeat protein (TIGR04076 family)